MVTPFLVGDFQIGDGKLTVIGGPCLAESDALCLTVAETMKSICAELGFNYVFKASFDKANRTSHTSNRGAGMEAGLDILRLVRKEHGVPVTTDVHLPDQCATVAESVDILQIPAFLCRQTDLLAAAAATGKPVNVKKGQFMSPEEMRNVLTKLQEGGCTQRMLTERGTFFGYNRLVTDFIGLGDMMALGAPVCFDATHSTQLPGGAGTATSGRPDRCAMLARAAVAAGVQAIFLECHPEPAKSKSDAGTVQPLAEIPALLKSLKAVRDALAV